MTDRRLGIWLVGAWGGVSTTVAVGLTALQQELTEPTALVTATPPFNGLDLAEWGQFVLGGHEIRKTSYQAEARRLCEQSGVFGERLLSQVTERLAEFDRNVRPGTVAGVGPTIESLAAPDVRELADEPTAETVQRLRSDLAEFRNRLGLDCVVVVNVASTEPPFDAERLPARWDDLWQQMVDQPRSPVPASTLYAAAAMLEKCPYVNFTPSLGASLPALQELAERQGVVHAGQDGKTGETLLKSVLAPLFAARNLKVLSWVGHNIFGNLDGQVLNDPANKASKVRTKDRLLGQILGYKPQTLVTIEYIQSMGDWKTAWDHVHFLGFLDTKMTLQFVWQGCDSLLAAPLVLDLVRLTELEQRRGSRGVLSHLAAFFKSPLGTDVADFFRQFQMLLEWAERVRADSGRAEA